MVMPPSPPIVACHSVIHALMGGRCAFGHGREIGKWDDWLRGKGIQAMVFGKCRVKGQSKQSSFIKAAATDTDHQARKIGNLGFTAIAGVDGPNGACLGR